MQNSQILEKVTTLLVPFDAMVLESSIDAALRRAALLKEFKASPEYKALRKDAFRLYKKLHEIAGGKSWYEILKGNEAGIIGYVKKNCANTVEKRNAKIAKKLSQISGELLDEAITHSANGFDGYYTFNTDDGKKNS